MTTTRSTSSNTLKAAIIGAGRIAAQHLACLSRLRGVEIAGVCDLSPATAQATAERFGARAWFTDHKKMLDETRPDLVHVTTTPPSHFPLARDVLAAGANVLVEKPITLRYDDFLELRKRADERGLWLIEDHNYQFNRPVQRILDLIKRGEFGDAVHVEMMYSLDLLAAGNPFTDANAPHPALTMPGGVIADFLPHMAYLVYLFVGPHRSARTIWSKRRTETVLPHDEFRGQIDAERGTAAIGFSCHSQPDGFWLHIHGTRMRATANLFEGRLTIDRLRSCPRPLMPVLNAREEGREVKRAAYRSLWGKLAGKPGAYEGLWECLARLYGALSSKSPSPIPIAQVDASMRLVHDLIDERTRQ